MSAPVSTSSIHDGLQTYFQARNADLQKLGQALQSGDLAGAKQEISAIQTLGQSGPFANSAPFKISQREQAFEAIGQALQSGDLAGAQKAFAQLKSTFHHAHPPVPSPAANVTPSGAASAPTADPPRTDSQPAAQGSGVNLTA
jgi:hypothetical protein